VGVCLDDVLPPCITKEHEMTPIDTALLIAVNYPHVDRISSVQHVTPEAAKIPTYRIQVGNESRAQIEPMIWLGIRDQNDKEEIWMHGSITQMTELRDAITYLIEKNTKQPVEEEHYDLDNLFV